MPSPKPVSVSVFRTGSIVLAALMVTGCATVPHASTDTPVAMSDLAASQSLIGDARGQWPAQEWWTDFNDPQLNTLMSEAFAHAPDIKAARARLEKAQSYYDQVRAVLSPTATLNVQTSETKSSINMGSPNALNFGGTSFNPKDLLPHGYWNLTRMTVDANYDLDVWGKSHAALQGSLGLEHAAQIEAQAARDTVALSIARAYVELDRLYKMRDSIALIKKGADIRVQLMQARADHELETADAVLRVKDDQTHLVEQLAQVDGAIRTQGFLIAALAGEGPDRGAQLQRPQLADIGPGALPADLPANLIGRRPDVVAARLRIEAQGENIRYTRADFYPNLNLTAYVGQQALSKGGFNELFATGSSIGSIGPAISLPIFNGGRLRAAYRGAEADYDSAVATYDQTLTTALEQVADAANTTQSTAAQLAAAQIRADDAEKAYELTKARFGRGIGTEIDVLIAHSQWVLLQNDLTTLKAQAFDDRLSLIAALGGGYQPASTVASK